MSKKGSKRKKKRLMRENFSLVFEFGRQNNQSFVFFVIMEVGKNRTEKKRKQGKFGIVSVHWLFFESD